MRDPTHPATAEQGGPRPAATWWPSTQLEGAKLSTISRGEVQDVQHREGVQRVRKCDKTEGVMIVSTSCEACRDRPRCRRRVAGNVAHIALGFGWKSSMLRKRLVTLIITWPAYRRMYIPSWVGGHGRLPAISIMCMQPAAHHQSSVLCTGSRHDSCGLQFQVSAAFAVASSGWAFSSTSFVGDDDNVHGRRR